MDKDIKRAEEKNKYLSSDPETLAVDTAKEKALHDRANMISSAKEEGIREAIERAIERGIEKGKLEMVENLLFMCVDIKAISKAPGIEVSEIERLKH